MNNDLISREDLKKAICDKGIKEICEKGMKGYEEYNQGLATALDLIDNAPTVEQHYVSDLPDDVIKTLQTLAIDYSDGIAVFKRKRPQGEWMFQYHSFDKDIYKCSNCGRLISSYASVLSEYKFCQECGADMRKGGAE